VARIYNKLPEELKNEVNDKSQELCKKTQDDEIERQHQYLPQIEIIPKL
jgi:hypothetical protein